MIHRQSPDIQYLTTLNIHTPETTSTTTTTGRTAPLYSAFR